MASTYCRGSKASGLIMRTVKPYLRSSSVRSTLPPRGCLLRLAHSGAESKPPRDADSKSPVAPEGPPGLSNGPLKSEVIRVVGKTKGGKREIKITPVEVLPPSRGDLKPNLYKVNGRWMDSKTALKRKELADKRKPLFTEEPLPAVDYGILNPDPANTSPARPDPTSGSWSSPEKLVAMTTGISPEARELVTYLVNDARISKKDALLYVTSAPSLLGVSLEGIKKEVEELVQVGFTPEEVAKLLPRFPSCLDMDWGNVREVYSVMVEEVGMTRNSVMELMSKHPFIFTLQGSKVQDALVRLQSLFQPREIVKLLNQTPLLACTPLTEEALNILQGFLKLTLGPGNGYLPPLLWQNMVFSPTRVELNEDTALLTALLYSHGADPQVVLKKCPHFYKQDANALKNVLTVLSSRPLFLAPQDIALLLEKATDTLCNISDTAVLRKHLDHLCKIFDTPSKVWSKMRGYVGLVDLNCNVKHKYRALISMGFNADQSKRLLAELPSLLVEDLHREFKPRLKLLLSVPGVTPSHLIESRRVLTLPLPMMEARVKFLSKHQPSLLTHSKLEETLVTSHEDFVTLCGCTMKTYDREVLRVISSSSITKKEKKNSQEEAAKTSPSLVIKSPSAVDVSQITTDMSLETSSSPATDQNGFPSPPLLHQSQPPGVSKDSSSQEKSLELATNQEVLCAPPLEDDSILDAPLEDTSILDAPLEDASILDASIIDTPLEDASILDAPLEDSPLEDTSIIDAPLEESDIDDDECNIDGSLANELEELMSKLSEASSLEYKLNQSNEVVFGEDIDLDLLDKDYSDCYHLPTLNNHHTRWVSSSHDPKEKATK